MEVHSASINLSLSYKVTLQLTAKELFARILKNEMNEETRAVEDIEADDINYLPPGLRASSSTGSSKQLIVAEKLYAAMKKEMKITDQQTTISSLALRCKEH